MVTVNLNELELNEFRSKDQPGQHCLTTFPMLGAHGTAQTATVYIELEPGDNLGRHTDSAEELLLVLEGEVEAFVGEESQKASQGSLVLVPEMVPHDIKNVGQKNAKILGIFGGANHIVATFDNKWTPGETRVIDTKMIFESVAQES